MKQLFTFLAAVLLTATTYAQVESPSQKETLSTVGLKTGVYILKVQAENIVFTKKLVIE
ncbi:T9SS type A sorting domain-containing protein [Formosa sp. Hel1_33_131]|uniref:T9SS type A sorting domain-containing protein n=1 Tax=Formosa sp. Hel1_33_131 TaxID=1336794 RepID=UPI0018D3231E|nr:T9SS type A sorting domain-containing protein [Formosa sp. Hel1_33_131]